MPRPERVKCTKSKGFRLTDELMEALEEEAAWVTHARRIHDPSAPEKTVSEVIKDCCIFRMTMVKALRVGFDVIRQLPESDQPQTGATVLRPV